MSQPRRADGGRGAGHPGPMARTGTKARRGVRPSRSPVRSGRLAVGRRRQAPSLSSTLVDWSTRAETLGLAPIVAPPLAGPGGVRWAFGSPPGLFAAVWGWRVHERLLRAAAAVVDFAFPTKPPPDERPLQTAPAWLPPVGDEDDEPGPTPIGVVAPELEGPADRLRRGAPPLRW